MPLLLKLFSLLALLPLCYGQTEIRDPTSPLRSYSTDTLAQQNNTTLILEAIISSDNSRFAIINGTRYKTGSIVNGVSIQKINKANVVLGDKNQHWILDLGTDLVLQGNGND